jgi:hypothetical protein
MTSCTKLLRYRGGVSYLRQRRLLNRDAAARFRNDQKDRLAFRVLVHKGRGPLGYD